MSTNSTFSDSAPCRRDTRRPGGANSSSLRRSASSKLATVWRRTRTVASRRRSTLSSTRWRNWQALLWFHEHGLDLPTRRNNGDVAWRRPSYATIHRMITNPIYGGAYAYGKSCVASGYGTAGVRVRSRRKTRSEWLALIPGTHEGYIDWERE